ncbi:N-terminal C2 in EEIG1 and EHBP1 proteins-domain-containing protein [Nemania sp. NC0429]|nr:N-terminal C2 in EEIG1 and EHBP1 proteins-domain-containing protein [Nemania sp. NC0429]
MRVLPIVNKARKPKFELHLWIYDLNNVPLVSGTSYVKWHLPNSIHGEHRGRTAKCSIDKIHHRVTYNYSKTIPLRISIDRANNLTECPIEFEVLQEFPIGSGNRDEKISLGNVRLNLSEYIEESEAFARQSTSSRHPGSQERGRDKTTGQYVPYRGSSASRSAIDAERTTLSSSPGTTMPHPEENDLVDEEAEEGIVRRYLMQDSKINSTLKIGILMVQADGERNYFAPPLKSASMFVGGISSIITGANEQGDAEDTGGGALPNLSKSRDTAEAQDMYRRALAASWDCHPGELNADECIEDIFAGGSGWRDGILKSVPGSYTGSPIRDRASDRTSSSGSGSPSMSSDDALDGTPRPNDIQRMQAHLRRINGANNRSSTSVASRSDGEYGLPSPPLQHARRSPHVHYRHHLGGGGGQHSPLKMHREDSGASFVDDSSTPALHSRTESLTSLAPMLGSTGSSSDRGSESKLSGFRRPKEMDEYELRDDLIAWKLPGTVS